MTSLPLSSNLLARCGQSLLRCRATDVAPLSDTGSTVTKLLDETPLTLEAGHLVADYLALVAHKTALRQTRQAAALVLAVRLAVMVELRARLALARVSETRVDGRAGGAGDRVGGGCVRGTGCCRGGIRVGSVG